MQVLKILYNIDYRGLNKINQEIEYIKDNKVLNRKKSYETFKLLLSKNKKIKNKKEKLTYKEIEDISGISKRTYYYINKEVKQKGLTYWKTLEIDNKNSTKNRRPKNFRKSKMLNNKEIIDKILKIRLYNPTYGKSKIKAILDREYKNINNIDNNNSNNIDNNIYNNIDNNIYNNINNNIPNNISESTIGRILKELSNKSLITLKGSKLNKKLKPNEINNTKPRNFNNSYSKRWNYKNNSITIKEKDNKNNNISNKNNIGTMIQIDHLKYHNSKINLRFVEFSAIEAQSRKMMCLHNHFSLSSHECLVPLTGLLLKINNLYYNKLKYLTKDFNSLSIKIEKELWEEFYYMDQLEQLQPLELRLKNSTTLKNLKLKKYLEYLT